MPSNFSFTSNRVELIRIAMNIPDFIILANLIWPEWANLLLDLLSKPIKKVSSTLIVVIKLACYVHGLHTMFFVMFNLGLSNL